MVETLALLISISAVVFGALKGVAEAVRTNKDAEKANVVIKIGDREIALGSTAHTEEAVKKLVEVYLRDALAAVDRNKASEEAKP